MLKKQVKHKSVKSSNPKKIIIKNNQKIKIPIKSPVPGMSIGDFEARKIPHQKCGAQEPKQLRTEKRRLSKDWAPIIGDFDWR